MPRPKLATSFITLSLLLGTAACEDDRDDWISPGGPPMYPGGDGDTGADDGADDGGGGDDGTADDGGEETGDGGGDGGTGDGGDDGTGDGGTDGGGDTTGGDGGATDTGDGGGVEGCPGADPGWGPAAQVGQPAPHWVGVDGSGANRELCEFYGKPIMVDLSALWCGPCQAFGAFMAGDDGALSGAGVSQTDVQNVFIPFRNKVEDGTIVYMTAIIDGQVQGAGPSIADVNAWENAFPSSVVHVWADMQNKWFIKVFPSGSGGIPAFIAIDPEFNWLTTDPSGRAFTDLLNGYG